MFRFLGRTTMIVALCLAVGLQWIALQSVAWASMIAQNARQTSFCVAVKRTFDGAHPCDLCKQLSKAKDRQEKRSNQRVTAKTDLICVIRQFVLLPPFDLLDYPELVSSVADSSQQPPSPPPRAVLT